MSARLAELLPVLSRHAGVWRGRFLRCNPAGALTEAFASEVAITLLDDEAWPDVYRQTNTYRRDDGSVEVLETAGGFHGDRIHFESDRVQGWSLDDPTDPAHRAALLFMTFKQAPGLMLYEQIVISDCDRFRSRTAQYLKDGKTVSRTLIDEERAA